MGRELRWHKTSLSLRILEPVIRVKVREPLPKTGSLVVVFHFRTKLNKKRALWWGKLRDQANRA